MQSIPNCEAQGQKRREQLPIIELERLTGELAQADPTLRCHDADGTSDEPL